MKNFLDKWELKNFRTRSDPDAIRIKLDQIMEWNDPNINPTSNK